MRQSRLWLLPIVFAALSACPWGEKNGDRHPTPPASTGGTGNTTDPQWVYRQETPARVAVVFVHGLFGDTLGTWVNKNGTRFFDLVAADPEIKDKIEILAFGYPSKMFAAGSFDIQAAAKALHARLEHHGILGYQKVVFVGHSMGGLVIMRELLMNRAAMPAVPLIVLMATPQEGSDIARIAQHVANNPALSQLGPADRNDLLKILNDDWNAWPDKPRVQCAYENTPTHGVMIVKWSSGTRLCDEATEISADHVEITKPDGPENLAVIVVTNALKKYVLDPALDPKLVTPDFAADGDHSVFRLSSSNSRLPARVENSGGSALQFWLAEPSDDQVLILQPDRPSPLAARSKDLLFVFLSSSASAPEYRFKLRTDYEPDRTVVVRAPSLAADRAQEVQTTVAAIEHEIQGSGVVDAWRRAPAEDGEVPEALVQMVHRQTTAQRPDWPEGLQWVITAETLNQLNWPGLAARALRRAEQAAPELVRQRSVQHLAAVTAAQSGDARVFAGVETPVEPAPPPAAAGKWLASGAAPATRLAQSLQQVPALQFYGLSLLGDAREATGDKEGARAAYQGAAVIRPSPSITKRLEVAGGWRTTASVVNGAGVAGASERTGSGGAAAAAAGSTSMVSPAAVSVERRDETASTAARVQPARVDPSTVVVRPRRDGE